MFTELKTRQSNRSIPLSTTAVAALRKHKVKQAQERLKLGALYQNFDLVFAAELGTPTAIGNLTKRHFKPMLKAAKLPDIRLYDLRHTCATLLLASGENPKVVSERLGHSSVVMTLDVYSHVLPNMQAAATTKMAQLLFGT